MNAVFYLKDTWVERDMAQHMAWVCRRLTTLHRLSDSEESSWPAFLAIHLGYAACSIGFSLFISACIANGHQLMQRHYFLVYNQIDLWKPYLKFFHQRPCYAKSEVYFKSLSSFPGLGGSTRYAISVNHLLWLLLLLEALFIYLKIYLLKKSFFGCIGSSLLCTGFL